MNDLVPLHEVPQHVAMFTSWQTWEGLHINVYSFKEVVKYLLENGVEYFLSERFCHDDQNYFGRLRTIGRSKEYPSIRDEGYTDNNHQIAIFCCAYYWQCARYNQ